MEINYELTPEDFYAFSKENAPTQKKHQPTVAIFMIAYLLFIFADIIYAFFSGSLNDWSFGAFLINIGLRTALTFFVIAMLLAIIKLISMKKLNDVTKGQENGLFCEHRIIMTENELIEVTDVNTSRYSWKAIEEIKEIESFVLINVVMSSSYVIPKRCFQDSEHIKKFVETANYYQQNAGNTFQPSHFTTYEKSLE